MKNNKKVLIGVLSVCLIMSLAIGGTLAFLTDSEKDVNTFTVGDLDITLTEPNWDDETDGKDLVPGDTVVKDPTVTAIDNNSYMRVVMTIKDSTTGKAITDKDRLALIMKTIRFDSTYNNATPTVGTGLVEGDSYKLADLSSYPTVNPAFTLVTSKSSSDTAATGVYYYNYNSVLAEGDKATLFTDVVIPTDWNQDQLSVLGKFEVEIFAQAIQSANFENATDAFAALDAEIAAGTAKEDYKTVNGLGA